MEPQFEEPLDTAKQLVEKNITLYGIPGSQIWKQFLVESSKDEYKILGENFLIPDWDKDWDNFYNIAKYDVIGAGTHAYMASRISLIKVNIGENKEINSGRGWYRSKERVEGHYPYAGYLTNKKWHLNKVIIKSENTDSILKTNELQSKYNNLRKWQDIYCIFNK